MGMIEIGNCPNCGAPLSADITNGAIVCQYCGSVIAISMPSAAECSRPAQNLGQGMKILLRKVQPELKFLTNFKESSANYQGGVLWITRNEVIFKPHCLNFGNLNKKYIRIQDVAGYSKGFLTLFSIWTMDGSEMGLVSWRKTRIINEIEGRRRAYYQSRGLPLPPLRFGNVSMR